MILFYNKKDGEIFATIDGRVHGKDQLKMYADKKDKDGKKIEVGKFIIGWIEKFDGKKTFRNEYNKDEFGLMKDFEDKKELSPLDFKIENFKLINK